MLARQVYLGHIAHADRRLLKRNTHAVLTSRATWTAAQDAPAPRASNGHFPLSGVIRCAACGEPMIGSRGGTGQRTYRCNRRCGEGPVVTAKLIEKLVRDRLRKAMVGLEAETDGNDDLTGIELRLEQAEEELDLFAADAEARRILGDRYHAALQTRVDGVEAVRQEYRDAAAAATQMSFLVPATELSQEVVAEMLAPDRLGPLATMIWDRMLVRRGRRLKIEDRVEFVGSSQPE